MDELAERASGLTAAGVARALVGGAVAYVAVAMLDPACELHEQGIASYLERTALGVQAVRGAFG